MNRMCPSLMKYHLKVGFPANATFRKKSAKIFGRTSRNFFTQKCENIFAKYEMRKFRKNAKIL